MLMVVLANFSAPVQGTIEAHRESMQRLEDKKKREAQSTLSREILLKRRRQEAAKAKSELPTASVKGGAFMNHLSHDLVCTTYQLLYVFD